MPLILTLIFEDVIIWLFVHFLNVIIIPILIIVYVFIKLLIILVGFFKLLVLIVGARPV